MKWRLIYSIRRNLRTKSDELRLTKKRLLTSLMWILRRHRTFVLACSLALCLLTLYWAYYFTNIFDLLFYFISFESKILPLSLQCNAGRLGNQMCTYATLYGISALNHRRSFVALSCNVNHLKDIFVGPSKVPSRRLYLKWHPWSLLSYLKPEDAAIPPSCNFLDGYKYPCSYTFFDHVKEDIRREFLFKEPFTEYAQTVLEKANAQKLPNATYVGVHVRRGDYKRWLDVFDGVPVNMEYFEKSLEYFREKYQNVIFVAVSNDRTWCVRNLSGRFGVHVPKEAPSPGHDLALLASCNHTVMTYGTFGFWGAYLAGGEVLYFDKFLRPNTTFTRTNFLFEKMYPPYWKGVVTIKESHWLQATDSNEDKNVTKKS